MGLRVVALGGIGAREREREKERGRGRERERARERWGSRARGSPVQGDDGGRVGTQQ